MNFLYYIIIYYHFFVSVYYYSSLNFIFLIHFKIRSVIYFKNKSELKINFFKIFLKISLIIINIIIICTSNFSLQMQYISNVFSLLIFLRRGMGGVIGYVFDFVVDNSAHMLYTRHISANFFPMPNRRKLYF